MSNSIIDFWFEIGSLRKITRSHRQSLLTEDHSDNIAAHSFRVTMIGYFLAKQAGADAHKVVLMCLFHDAGEARSGDQNWIHKRYVKVFEDEITQEQLDGILPDNEPYQLAQEYAARQSLEAKIAKDADLLEQALLVKEHIQAGNQEALTWIEESKADELHLEISQDYYRQIIQTSPTNWWKKLWTSQRR